MRRSDVLVHNMRVGVAERLGIDYESARAIRPDIIYVHSTAYGPSGPEAKKAGFRSAVPVDVGTDGLERREVGGADLSAYGDLRRHECLDASGSGTHGVEPSG